jgi:hypothetical protein
MRGALDLGMRPTLSRKNIESPGIINIGVERAILEKEV